jgi:hypothetical protein
VTFCWKTLDESYNFALDLISIEGLHATIWAPKVVEVSIVGILGLPLGSLETKWHLGVSPVAKHKVYYKGEGDGFPQVWAMVNLVSSNLPMVHLSTKNVLAMHEPTCYLVLCRFMWVSDCLSFFLVPSQSSNMPLYPQSAVSQKVCPNSLLLRCFHFKLTFESIKELGNASFWLGKSLWKQHTSIETISHMGITCCVEVIWFSHNFDSHNSFRIISSCRFTYANSYV